MMKCCFDKRVWLGLGLLAAGLLVFSPHLGWVALPVLAGLACPLSMLVMMRGMRRGAACAREPEGGRQAEAGRAAGIAGLRREIELLRHHAGEPGAASYDQRAVGADRLEPASGRHDGTAAARDELVPGKRQRPESVKGKDQLRIGRR
jgi:hypothetical protein